MPSRPVMDHAPSVRATRRHTVPESVPRQSCRAVIGDPFSLVTPVDEAVHLYGLSVRSASRSVQSGHSVVMSAIPAVHTLAVNASANLATRTLPTLDRVIGAPDVVAG